MSTVLMRMSLSPRFGGIKSRQDKIRDKSYMTSPKFTS